jgi:hypothetical protein
MKYALMKPLAIAAVAALLLSSTLEAQQANRPDRERRAGPPSAEQQLVRLSEALNLRDGQAIRLLEVLQNGRADHEALQERMMQDYGAEICAQRERMQEQILAVLDSDQAALFEQHRARLQNRALGGPQRLDCTAYDN